MEQFPMVSVVMATFNEPAPIITQAIRSILDQTWRSLELLVVDDSTNSETVLAIDALAAVDSRVVVVRRKERIGFVPALNIGLEMARGAYIARMDGDDVAVAERLASEVSFLEANPEVSIVGAAMYIINEHDTVTSERNYPLTHKKIVRYAALRNPFAHPTVLFRRTVIDQGFRYDTRLKNCEDLDLWLRLINHGFKTANLPDKLLRYRVVGNLATKRNTNNWKANRRVRMRNFSWKRPCLSFIALTAATLYAWSPTQLVAYIYKRENNKR